MVVQEQQPSKSGLSLLCILAAGYSEVSQLSLPFLKMGMGDNAYLPKKGNKIKAKSRKHLESSVKVLHRNAGG